MYNPVDQPIRCPRHQCDILVGGCPECRREADEDMGVSMSEELIHS